MAPSYTPVNPKSLILPTLDIILIILSVLALLLVLFFIRPITHFLVSCICNRNEVLVDIEAQTSKTCPTSPEPVKPALARTSNVDVSNSMRVVPGMYPIASILTGVSLPAFPAAVYHPASAMPPYTKLPMLTSIPEEGSAASLSEIITAPSTDIISPPACASWETFIFPPSIAESEESDEEEVLATTPSETSSISNSLEEVVPEVVTESSSPPPCTSWETFIFPPSIAESEETDEEEALATTPSETPSITNLSEEVVPEVVTEFSSPPPCTSWETFVFPPSVEEKEETDEVKEESATISSEISIIPPLDMDTSFVLFNSISESSVVTADGDILPPCLIDNKVEDTEIKYLGAGEVVLAEPTVVKAKLSARTSGSKAMDFFHESDELTKADILDELDILSKMVLSFSNPRPPPSPPSGTPLPPIPSKPRSSTIAFPSGILKSPPKHKVNKPTALISNVQPRPAEKPKLSRSKTLPAQALVATTKFKRRESLPSLLKPTSSLPVHPSTIGTIARHRIDLEKKNVADGKLTISQRSATLPVLKRSNSRNIPSSEEVASVGRVKPGYALGTSASQARRLEAPRSGRTRSSSIATNIPPILATTQGRVKGSQNKENSLPGSPFRKVEALPGSERRSVRRGTVSGRNSIMETTEKKTVTSQSRKDLRQQHLRPLSSVVEQEIEEEPAPVAARPPLVNLVPPALNLVPASPTKAQERIRIWTVTLKDTLDPRHGSVQYDIFNPPEYLTLPRQVPLEEFLAGSNRF